jgi:pimeloyl-ACP methyl ester carboxylesterase
MCGVVLTAVFYTATVGLAAAQAVVADLPVPSGGTERAAFLAAPQARATVVLLAGGEGIVPIDNAGNSGNQNFLIRTRTMWQQYGINAVILASPNGSSLMGQRAQPAYPAALAVTVDFARSRANVPVWLVGTSNGTIAAVNGGTRLGGKVAGIILTSSVTQPGRAGGRQPLAIDRDCAGWRRRRPSADGWSPPRSGIDPVGHSLHHRGFDAEITVRRPRLARVLAASRRRGFER